jgi:hypothetical protein
MLPAAPLPAAAKEQAPACPRVGEWGSLGVIATSYNVQEGKGIGKGGDAGLGEDRRGVNCGDVAVALEIIVIEGEDAFDHVDVHGSS